jgi:hypothetical protein
MQDDEEKLQQNEINSLTLNMILYATIATLCVALLSVGLKMVHLSEISPQLMFMPWGIVMVVGISTAYRRGYKTGRSRQ